MTTLLLFLAACTAPDDTGGVTGDDTGIPSPVSLDAILGGEPDAAWSCGWAYLVAAHAAATLVGELALPPEDRYANLDVAYTRALGPEDRVRVGHGAGGDDLDVFDCGDVMEVVEGVRVWTAVEGTLLLDAVYTGERPEWTCDGASPNPTYAAEVSLVDLRFVDGSGAEATLSAWGPHPYTIGADFCGG